MSCLPVYRPRLRGRLRPPSPTRCNHQAASCRHPARRLPRPASRCPQWVSPSGLVGAAAPRSLIPAPKPFVGTQGLALHSKPVRPAALPPALQARLLLCRLQRAETRCTARSGGAKLELGWCTQRQRCRNHGGVRRTDLGGSRGGMTLYRRAGRPGQAAGPGGANPMCRRRRCGGGCWLVAVCVRQPAGWWRAAKWQGSVSQVAGRPARRQEERARGHRRPERKQLRRAQLPA